MPLMCLTQQWKRKRLPSKYLLCFFFGCAVVNKWRTLLLLGQASSSFKGSNSSSFKRNSNSSYAPGRFKQSTYPNVSIEVQFTKNPKATPYRSTHCAPGLTCLFSDKTWHEVKWSQNTVAFPQSPKLPNTIRISAESPGHCSHLDLLNKGLHAGLATIDLNSDVPVSLYTSIYDVLRPKSNNIKHWRILNMISNCENAQSNRNALVEALEKRGLVDSYGRCHHNIDWNNATRYPPPGTKEKLIPQYAFVAAFENSYSPGYVTEKLGDPLALGSLPIYLGAPNAKLMFPESSFIDVNDFRSFDDLADYIDSLIENHDEYDRHHAWRENSISEELDELWQFSKQDINCRLCRWAAENLYT